jgi:aminoglycoside phosphotransferase (APT) family kinase protein
MLTPDDAAVAAREEALPGLALLLDADAFAAALRERLPDAGVTSASEFYARYKPGRSSVVAYRVKVGDAEVDVYARAMPRASFEGIEDMRQPAPVAGPLGAGELLLEDAAVSVWVFPNDRDIEALALLGRPDTRAELLAEVLPDRPALWGAHAARLRYWPERRFVARLETEDGDGAALKLYAERSYRAAGHNALAFVSRGELRLAECLGRSDRHRAVAFEWLPGRPLDQVMVDPGFDDSTLASVGAALAEIHAQQPPGLTRRSPGAESKFLHTRARWVGSVRPDLAERTRILAEHIDRELQGHTAAAECSIHGDFTPRQVLVTADGVSIIDLDDATLGEPAEDLGVFISRLELLAVSGNLTAARAQAFVRALLDGYEASAGPGSVDRPAVTRHVAAELVRRLPGAFRRRGDNWMSVMVATLARAEEIA